MPIEQGRLTALSHAVILAISLAAVFVIHAPFFDLPFFWDEVGQFIPASLDLFQSGALVPKSVTPNAHPPGVMAYLSLIWSITGYSVAATRAAMLFLAGICVYLVFLLAIKLKVGSQAALFATLLLCSSPVFYAQAMLAQLDMPAMLFTLLATLLFVEERIFLSAAACVALVLVKETSIITPFLFGLSLLAERRYRQSVYFFLPAVALACWLALLRHETGHLFGSAEFTEYNLRYMLHPARMLVALAKRVYHLFWENLGWIGTAGIVYGFARRRVFARRTWAILWILVALHIVLFSVLGGAMLERYLLPVAPIVCIGMVAGWSAMPSPWRVAGPVVLIAAAAASSFWNPPYPFPLENNLAFTDFVRLQQLAADYVEQRYPGTPIATAWPLSAVMAHPEFGYVKTPQSARELIDFDEASMAGLNRADIDVFILYSRQWNPPGNLLRNPSIVRMWRQFFSFEPPVSSSDVDGRLGLKIVASWKRRGQWIEIHARY